MPNGEFRNAPWNGAKRALKQTYHFAKRIIFRSKVHRCPVCDFRGADFSDFGNPVRKNARCPGCGALERHRFAWLLLNEKTDLFDLSNKPVLHVAPEACFEDRLRSKLGNRYVTADLLSPSAMVKMDITDIDFPDESFGAVLCSHVLEHVQDDQKAMRELFRVLREDGWALLDVPIAASVTYEDESIVDPQERLAAFGQEDHVRKYGPDYVDRLREAGFEVDVCKVDDFVTEDVAEQMGILPLSRSTFLCFKRTTNDQTS